MDTDKVVSPDNVRLHDDGTKIIIIDQTQLPGRLEYMTLESAQDVFDAIFELKVRGAPAIGICAGFAMYCLAQRIKANQYDEFLSEFRKLKKYLNSSRPTAVNLSWALNRMENTVLSNSRLSVHEIVGCLGTECRNIQQEDIRMCRAISEYGLSLIHDGDGILTHCNAGPLATSCYGTALGPLILGKERGMEFKVFSDETRPLLQGARLTAYELQNAGIDVTLICDSMAGLVMKNGWIQACFVGCDRIASNGDTANKIGTGSIAVLASYYKIPFYVLGPTSTIDMTCGTGADIPIELRPEEEITNKYFQTPIAPLHTRCYNPAFDITDSGLISAIITEAGICRPPYRQSLAALFRSK